jgi:hypothetical protein
MLSIGIGGWLAPEYALDLDQPWKLIQRDLLDSPFSQNSQNSFSACIKYVIEREGERGYQVRHRNTNLIATSAETKSTGEV